MTNIFSTNFTYSYAQGMNFCAMPMFVPTFSFVPPKINFGYQKFFAPNVYTMNPFASNTYYERNIFGNRINKQQPVHNTLKTKTYSSNNISKTTQSSYIKSPKIEKPKAREKQDLRNDFIQTSRKYLGFNEADGSSKMISKSGEWCADFIKYVINESYRDKGLTPPTSDLRIEPGMPHLRVENIKQWGIKHDTYLPIAGKSNKAQTIASKVKPGDVFILRENASHTGFVSKVYKDGSFDSIEGNRDDKVTTHHYQANDPMLSGFVQVRS